MLTSRREFIRLTSLLGLSSLLGSTTALGLVPTEPMPAFFIGHGSPLNAIQDNQHTLAWRELASQFDKPAAILAISAHWQSRNGSFLTSNPWQRIIYDMRGFPQALYEVKYPAQGLPSFKQQMLPSELQQEIVPTERWGLDHGSWSVLVHMYPEADIPVVQLSLNADLSPIQHLNLAKEISALRHQGVLVLGSGNLVHNLPRRRQQTTAFDWAEEFDQYVAARVLQGDFSAVANYQSLGRLAYLAHPTNEHFLPLLYVLGVASKRDTLSWHNASFYKGSISMRCLMVS
ncbi:MAG: 4,5-DOPA dioxygenase extradiol [Gammaproteobacteria bacterium]|jgi:4,5-DOPA dioxygenase extradiol|nr:4,5-DOPA dioxygenase extradiol [Gammaproteobacteria bacterium]MBT5601096.1 4,5-DOPA dioxygenase extradiol [Gammaproteobacteria bacterium]MBT6247224.1 4,5-DOPA dioxygenase extradiol [Gammaproteobacteria bacterium]